MPLTPSAIRNRRIAIAFPYAGDSVNIEYYAAKLGNLTKERFAELQKRLEGVDDESEAAAMVADVMMEFLASWDLVEDDGAAMPLTHARIVRLIVEDEGTDVLTDMLTAVQEDVRQRKASGMPTSTRLSDTSSQTGALTHGRNKAASRKRTKSR